MSSTCSDVACARVSFDKDMHVGGPLAIDLISIYDYICRMTLLP